MTLAPAGAQRLLPLRLSCRSWALGACLTRAACASASPRTWTRRLPPLSTLPLPTPQPALAADCPGSRDGRRGSRWRPEEPQPPGAGPCPGPSRELCGLPRPAGPPLLSSGLHRRKGRQGPASGPERQFQVRSGVWAPRAAPQPLGSPAVTGSQAGVRASCPALGHHQPPVASCS